jgi:hypothetical protein
MRNTLLPILALAWSACSGAKAGESLANIRTETLPNGVTRVMSEGPTAWAAGQPASLVEEVRFQGEDGTPSELGEPRDLAVDALGRIYVVDGKPAAIKVFAPDGQYIRTIGREGEGPGEFRIAFIAIRDEHLVVQDPRVSRLSVFDTSGKFLRSWKTTCCYWSKIQLDDADLVYVPSMSNGKPNDPPRGTPYVRWTLDGVAKDTVWIPYQKPEKLWNLTVTEGGKMKMSMSTTVPFMPGMTSALHPQGGVVYGWTSRYEIVRSNTGADSALVFGRDWSPDPITDDRRNGEYESRIKSAGKGIDQATVRNAFKLEDIPSTLPAYETLQVDPTGRVWARRYAVSDTTRTNYDLFDAKGAYLGPVSTPLHIVTWGPQAWTPFGVVAVIEDQEGRPTVVRLKLVTAASGH